MKQVITVEKQHWLFMNYNGNEDPESYVEV